MTVEAQLWIMFAFFTVPMGWILWRHIVGDRKAEEKETTRIKKQSDQMLEQMEQNVAERKAKRQSTNE